MSTFLTVGTGKDHASIAAALAAASGDTVILVYPGTYAEGNLTWATSAKQIRLIGVFGAKVTIVDSTTKNNCIVFSDSHHDELIEGFTFKGAGREALYLSGQVDVRSCIFTANGAVSSYAYGIRVKNDYGTSVQTISRCLFYDNAGKGGINYSVNTGSVVVKDCTFMANANGATEGTAIHFNGDSTNFSGKHLLVWKNTPSTNQISSSGDVTYSDVEGSFAGTGNIDADPLFVSEALDDYRLSWGAAKSPCIAAGDAGDKNPNWGGKDIGAHWYGEGDYDEAFPADGVELTSEQFRVNFTKLRFLGVGGRTVLNKDTGVVVDMGAISPVFTESTLYSEYSGVRQNRSYHVVLSVVSPTSAATIGTLYYMRGDVGGANPERYFRIFCTGTNQVDAVFWSLRPCVYDFQDQKDSGVYAE